MNGLLERWGLWCRVGLGRPRLTSVHYGDGAVGEDFNEDEMRRLDRLIGSLGEPTARFVEYVYRYEWSARDAANAAGFKLGATSARDLLTRVLRRLDVCWSKGEA